MANETMKAGRELDAMIAEALGAEVRWMAMSPEGAEPSTYLGGVCSRAEAEALCATTHGRANGLIPRPWVQHAYSQEIAAAWLVVEKMRDREWHVLIDDNRWDNSANALGGEWMAMFTHRTDDGTNRMHGVTTGDLRYSAENIGLLTGEESLAYMNRLQLGKVIRDAGGLSTGQMRRSKVKAAKRSPNVVYALLEFVPRDAGAA